MPGLYGLGNANVTTSVLNTTGLYIGNGSVGILNSAETLLSLLSNVGTVGFALTNSNNRVLGSVLASGVTAGTYGSNIALPIITVGGDGRITNILTTPITIPSAYGNANVAAYLPTDPTITGIQANIGGSELYANLTFATKTNLQTLDANVGAYETWANAHFGTSSYSNVNVAAYIPTDPYIQALNANLGAFETYANAHFGTSSYSNVNVAAYIPTDPTISGIQANIGGSELYANATFATQTALQVLDANIGAYEAYANSAITTNSTNIQTLSANVGAYEIYANANAASQQTSINTNATNIQTLNANVGAYETWANAAFLTSSTAVTQIIAGSNITISPPSGQGIVTISSTGGSGGGVSTTTGYYLNAYDTTTQSAANATTAYVVKIGNIASASGITVTNGNAVSFTNQGVYAVELSLQLINNDNALHNANVWVRQNGTDVAYSNSNQTLQARASVGNPSGAVLTIPYIVNANAGDTMQFVWQTDGPGQVAIITEAAGATPTRPAVPGVILTAQAVANIVGLYGNSNVAVYLPYDPTISSIQANIGGSETYANVTFATKTALQTLDANVGAYEAYANATFLNTGYKFNGDLFGNVLYDSVNGRIFANAFPLSTPSTTNAAQTAAITNAPTYTGGVLQQGTGNQTISQITSANVALQSKYDATNRNTIGSYLYLQAWPATANSMTNSDRVRASVSFLDVQLNGRQWTSSNLSAQYSLVGAQNTTSILGSGYAGHAIGTFNTILQQPTGGSANIGYATGSYSYVQTATTGVGYTASNIGVARLFSGCVLVAGNLGITNAVGLHTVSGWGSTATNKYAVLNEDPTSTITTNGNIVQSGFSPALTATFSNIAWTGQSSPGFQFTANTSGSLTGNVFYLGNVQYSSLQQIMLDSNITVVSTTAASARQWDFLIYSYGTNTITWPATSTVYGSVIPNSTTYAKVTQFGSTNNVTVAYTQNPSVWYSNVNANGYTLSNVKIANAPSTAMPTGSIGSIAAVNNNGGKLAYWDTTNNRWSYVFDNSAV